MTETKTRRSRLAQIQKKIADDSKSVEEDIARASQINKRTIEINDKSEYQAVEIKDSAPIEETTKTTTKTLALTQELMRRLETLEVQQKNDIGPRFTALEEKITENSKGISELLELLKNQPKIQELDYKLEPEPTPEPEPEIEPMPELPPLPQLDEEPPLELDSEPEIPPLPELKLPEEEKLEDSPKQEVPKMDSETQTDQIILPNDEEREKRRAERKQRHQKTETANNADTETCEVKERDIQINENEIETKDDKEEIQNENVENIEVATEEIPKENIEQEQAIEEKIEEKNDLEAGGCKLSFELLALIVLIILEIAHLYVISK